MQGAFHKTFQKIHDKQIPKGDCLVNDYEIRRLFMKYKDLIALFEGNFEKVKTYLGWSADKRIVIMMASYYTAKGKVFSPQSFNEVIEAIKQQTKWYHTLRTSVNLQNSIAMLLDGKGDATTLITDLLANEEVLKAAKFSRTQYSYIAASVFPKVEGNKAVIAENAQKLYKAIRKHHPFLTSNEDIPYVVLLSSGDDTSEVRAETMNRYYKELRKFDFYIGNELQWLSQILTFHSANYVEHLVPYVVEIRKQLQENGIKLKYMHYPLLGFLAVAGVKSDQIEELSQLYKELSQIKQFRWYKDAILSVVVQKLLNDHVSINESHEMSIVTSLEALIQAEQAMVITATMAAVVASSSSSSSN